jgi:hypothetical protein
MSCFYVEALTIKHPIGYSISKTKKQQQTNKQQYLAAYTKNLNKYVCVNLARSERFYSEIQNIQLRVMCSASFSLKCRTNWQTQ